MEQQNHQKLDNLSEVIISILKRAKDEKEKHKNAENVSWEATDQLTKTTWLLGLFQVTLIILFATLGGSEILDPLTAPGTGTQGYNMFIGVEVMMFVGFGYLMTFLKWYGLGAVGFTMMVVAVGIQWSLFTESFFTQAFNTQQGQEWQYVQINIYSLLNTLYAISAVLISFGAIIGKVSPLQLLAMTIIELACHSVNYKVLMVGALNVVDVGGTYSDHMFGAYFGLAVSYILGTPTSEPEMGNTPDIFSLVGTVFLWIYWPSFVIGAAPADSIQQQHGVVNTILSLSASTICAFWLSSILSKNGRFRPVDVQNATLAGGVAIGCTANLSLSAFGAVMIGCTAGIVSTAGYNILQPYLEKQFSLHDTCGIHNLHAMPSVIGALASVILAGYKGTPGRHHDSALYGWTEEQQWWRQWLGILLCMGFAIFTGVITGKILQALNPAGGVGQKDSQRRDFHDDRHWDVAEDYGTSLYSELMLLLRDADDYSGIKLSVANSIPEWSSHGGRRPKTPAIDLSQSDSMRPSFPRNRLTRENLAAEGNATTEYEQLPRQVALLVNGNVAQQDDVETLNSGAEAV